MNILQQLMTKTSYKEETLKCEQGNFLILDTSSAIWLVGEGTVYVFACQLDHGEVRGRRQFIIQINKGEIFSGASLEDMKSIGYVFIATSTPNAKVYRFETRDFLESLVADSYKVREMISHWFEELSKAVCDEGVIRKFREFLESQQSLLADSTTEHINNLNLVVLKYIVDTIEKSRLSEEELFNAKKESNDSYLRKSLSNLILFPNKSKKVRKRTIHLELSTNPLVAACQVIGKNMKINIVEPRAELLRDQSTAFDAIMKVSQIQYRKIVLSGNWWQRDSGPFLSSLKEDGTPVALLPVSPTRYELFNPLDNTSAVVDQKVAALVDYKAFTFYKSFPKRVLNLIDVLKFGIQGPILRDARMIIAMAIFGGLMSMFIPIATGIIFDTIIPQGDKSQMLQIIFLLAAVTIAGVLFQLTRAFAVLRASGRISTSVQCAVWDRVLSLPTSFFRKFTSGELAMRVMGVERIMGVASGSAMTTLLSGIFSIFNYALLFYYSSKMALIATVLILINTGMTIGVGVIQLKYNRQMLNTSNKLSGYMQQVITSIAKFRITGSENRVFFQWSKLFHKQRAITIKGINLQNVLSTFNAIFGIICSMTMFYIMSGSNVGAGAIVAFNSAFVGVIGSVSAISDVLMSANIIVPLYENTKPIFETLPEYDEAKVEPGRLNGDIEVSHVTFRYKKDDLPVLKDVSIRIKPGEYVALVGSSGSGKSTLLRLLLGFEKAETGKIYYDGNDIEKVDVRSVRKQLGVVLQNGQLISGDILTNILGANANLTIKDAQEAVKMAGLYDDIELMPMGMYTMVSEGAGTLSGGQRQRLLIARAIVNKPNIIYFDEATSALDNRTQEIVCESIDKLKATKLIIAHRLSTIVNCDRIIVLEKGEIIEDGTYNDLMNKKGVFYNLASRQLA